MSLPPGTRLGPYEVIAPLGAGGMGEVYRARDTKLGRDVALKILPDTFAQDPDRLARFQREAHVLASLNHPNIGQIYGLEDSNGSHALVMELVDGQELGALIPADGLPLQRLLTLALPLADALGAAHQRAIVHRDVKPSNVMVGSDGRVKILDFGLAKVISEAQDERDPAVVSTQQLTADHRVLGTPAYMSPEQAEGKQIDARSDIFSFGVMLYEMASGRRPFQGDSALAIVSAILKDTPTPLAQIKPGLPADVDRIVRRCLAKDPARRFQTALDVRNELEDLEKQIAAGGASVVRRPAHRARGRVVVRALVGLGVCAAVTATVLWRPFGSDTRVLPTARSFDRLTSQSGAELFPSLSPDGGWIVYAGEGSGNRDIFLQSVTGQTPINLTQDSPADDDQPAFSPDGERIAFRSERDGGGIFAMGRTGEGVRRLTGEGFNPAWSPDGGEIAYTTVPTEFRPQNAEQRGQLMVISVNGGEPRRLLDAAMLPRWSPDGQRIAFSGRIGRAEGTSNIGTVPAAGGEAVAVTDDSFLNWNPIWSPGGTHLYFSSNRGGSMNIWRVAIDESSGVARGGPEPITSPATFAAHLSMSSDGRVLAYTAVLETQNIQRLRLDPVQGDVIGEPMAVTTGSRFWANPDPSPDGASVVFYSQVEPEGDLYVARSDGSGGLRQLTDDQAVDRVPRWSPDGSRIAMFSDRSGALCVWEVRADGSGLRQVTPFPASVAAWSPEGQRLAVTRHSEGGPNDQTVASVVDPDSTDAGTRIDLPPVPLANPRFAPNSWSPDGREIAGQNGFNTLGLLIYSLDARRYTRVLDFGEWPVWLPDSRRILFVSRGRDFHILDTVTKTSKLIYSSVRDTLGPPRLTRDGRLAFFSRRVTEADIWVTRLE